MADLDDFLQRAARDEAARLDAAVCDRLMLAYYDFVYHLACTFLGDQDEADDAAQETFLQAVLHLHQYEPGTNLKSWIAKITINTCRIKYRKQKARRRLEAVLKLLTHPVAPDQRSPEESAITGEQQRLLRQAVDALDEKHRMPVLLRYVHGMSVPEIAQALAEKEGTIHSRLHYAHRKLRDRLGSRFTAEYGTEAGER
jgi:RNA polymerase sigma-70 factor (ECF subfamily)